MRRNSHFVNIGGMVIVLVLLALAACEAQPETPYAGEMLLNTPAQQSGAPCEACDRATLSAALTQESNSADNQAAATAAILRANAQATLNSANATLAAAQTQEQNDANLIAATAAIVRANAQATLNSAGATQNAAQTQDAIRQTQIADLATTEAEAMLYQQNKDERAAGTQTAIANSIATQNRIAAVSAQWYADQRNEKRQAPITFLWLWCLPIFIVLLAGLVLWGFWRWMRIRQANQRILENPVEKLLAPAAEIVYHQQDDPSPYIENDIVDVGYQLSKPDDRVRGWMDEVKRKLLSSDKKDEDDGTHN